MITVPENIVADLIAAVRDVMNGIGPAIIVFIGISVAFYAAREVKRLMPKTSAR